MRAGDLLNQDSTAAAPNRCWVTDFTYLRSWAGWAYVAFIVDVFSQRIIAWHAATRKNLDLVMTPLRMTVWQRQHEGHPIEVGHLIHHSDPGDQYTSMALTKHLATDQTPRVGTHPTLDQHGRGYPPQHADEDNNGLYKAKCARTTTFHDGPYKTITDIEYATTG